MSRGDLEMWDEINHRWLEIILLVTLTIILPKSQFCGITYSSHLIIWSYCTINKISKSPTEQWLAENLDYEGGRFSSHHFYAQIPNIWPTLKYVGSGGCYQTLYTKCSQNFFCPLYVIWDTCLILSGKTKTMSQWFELQLTLKRSLAP